MDKVENFTVAYTLNETGFGVMTINYEQNIAYQHYSTKRGYVDSMVI